MTAQAKIEAPPNIVGALAIALPELGAVTKNKKNPHFKSSYADLSAVIQALAPIAEYGLWFRQEPRDDAGSVGFETFYIYRDGSELSAGITRIPVNKNDAQGYGSAQTYCRRYALQAAFGLAAEDDDGNAAARAKPEPVAQAEMPDAELAKLVQLIKATGADRGKMLKLYGVNDLRKLDQAQYAEAVELLNKKLADKAKAETDAQAREVENV